jgi:DNA-directed RNA polymerase subunit RPC12/RpoP
MTSRTRHYIDLEDLLGLRFECKNCGTSVDANLNNISSLPQTCPNCSQSWMVKPRADMPGGAAYLRISEFVETYKAMKKELEGEFSDSKFTLSLEVTAPAINR